MVMFTGLYGHVSSTNEKVDGNPSFTSAIRPLLSPLTAQHEGGTVKFTTEPPVNAMNLKLSQYKL